MAPSRTCEMNSPTLTYESEVFEAIARRFDAARKKAKSETCRELVEKEMRDSLIAYVDEHSSKYPKHQNLYPYTGFKNRCNESLSSYRKPKIERDPNDIAVYYLIIAHSKSDQLIRLIDRLYHSNHVFGVHFDAKTEPSVLSRFRSLLRERSTWKDNVHILPDRSSVLWGGWGMMQATLEGMKHMIQLIDDEEAPRRFDYFINLSETSYPLRNDADIRAKLASFHPRWNVLGMKPYDHPHSDHYKYVQCDNTMFRVGRYPFPRSARLYQGSQFIMLEPVFSRYVLKQTAWIDYFKHFRVPDESFVQTVIMNSPFCHTQVHDDTHMFRWAPNDRRPGSPTCLLPDPRACGRRARTMTMRDLKAIGQAHNLFVRKVDEDVDVELMDTLDRFHESGELRGVVYGDLSCYDVKNQGKDCFRRCGNKPGHCPKYCGKDGFCCREGWQADPTECGGLGGASHHTCICNQTRPICKGGASGMHATADSTLRDTKKRSSRPFSTGWDGTAKRTRRAGRF